MRRGAGSGDSLSANSELNRTHLQGAPTPDLGQDDDVRMPTNGATGVRGALRERRGRYEGLATTAWGPPSRSTGGEDRAAGRHGECAWACAKDGSRLGAGLEARSSALEYEASFCGGVQGGALAVTPGPASRNSRRLGRLRRFYVHQRRRAPSSWGSDQAPLSEDAHCNAHPELALPSSPRNNTAGQRRWALP